MNQANIAAGRDQQGLPNYLQGYAGAKAAPPPSSSQIHLCMDMLEAAVSNLQGQLANLPGKLEHVMVPAAPSIPQAVTGNGIGPDETNTVLAGRLMARVRQINAMAFEVQALVERIDL